MNEEGLSALISYDFDNIGYITGTHVGEWNRDKSAARIKDILEVKNQDKKRFEAERMFFDGKIRLSYKKAEVKYLYFNLNLYRVK